MRRYGASAGGPPPQVGWPTLYIELMEFDLPLYAVQRRANGTWLVRTPMGDPLWPAVDVVAVVGEQHACKLIGDR